MNRYEHTQQAPLHYLLLLCAVGLLLLSHFSLPDVFSRWITDLVALVIVFFAFCFRHLTVRDETDALAVRYGPLPVFRTRIRYRDITAVARARSSWIDGWGIHYLPGRGWTYNLWGFDCVEISCGSRLVRLGTDDPAGLLAFLETRLAQAPASS